jgi:hypothetical protein
MQSSSHLHHELRQRLIDADRQVAGRYRTYCPRSIMLRRRPGELGENRREERSSKEDRAIRRRSARHRFVELRMAAVTASREVHAQGQQEAFGSAVAAQRRLLF